MSSCYVHFYGLLLFGGVASYPYNGVRALKCALPFTMFLTQLLRLKTGWINLTCLLMTPNDQWLVKMHVHDARWLFGHFRLFH